MGKGDRGGRTRTLLMIISLLCLGDGECELTAMVVSYKFKLRYEFSTSPFLIRFRVIFTHGLIKHPKAKGQLRSRKKYSKMLQPDHISSLTRP